MCQKGLLYNSQCQFVRSSVRVLTDFCHMVINLSCDVVCVILRLAVLVQRRLASDMHIHTDTGYTRVHDKPRSKEAFIPKIVRFETIPACYNWQTQTHDRHTITANCASIALRGNTRGMIYDMIWYDNYDMIWYDYFNVRSKADRCQLNLPHSTKN